ncbi:MAG: hypothetical protein AAGF88_05355 [Pseudomonadota bacterium]
MTERFSLKDHLFNAETIGQLADEFSIGVKGFPKRAFVDNVLAGFPERELLQRLDWIADCLEPHLPRDFPAMADAVEAAMPAPLDPTLRDDDFGHFIHAVPGILAVRHGLDAHRERALDLLHAATKRFSMELYIRPFLNRWPEETLARLAMWVRDENYHVRRLVSEGTRPRLPWAQRLDLDPLTPLPLLDQLHADHTRFVTRSVANHLNDITKFAADMVYDRLDAWHAEGRGDPKELAWMTAHALRSEIKAGAPRAMAALGYRTDAPVSLEALAIAPTDIAIGGTAEITLTLSAPEPTPVLVDYVMGFRKAAGTQSPKVFKLKQAQIKPGKPLTIKKRHRFKADATTFTLYPGAQQLSVQVNGRILGSLEFNLHA